MLRNLKADLHIHTCLSPCTELDMLPKAIIETAKTKRIDILGICDHNSAENVPAVMKAAIPYEINVLPGIEVTSQEEVHILALFDDMENAFELQDIIYSHLPEGNGEKAFGMQAVVNEKNEVLGFNKKLLIGASTLSLEEIIQKIHEWNGLAIASHIDREGFGLIGQLGFIPEGLELDALEISSAMSHSEAMKKFNPRYPLTCSSDAHYLEDIGRSFTSFYIEKSTIREMKKALLKEDGRKVIH